MTQFHEGQDVEVKERNEYGMPSRHWRKAKISKRGEPYSKTWRVEFPNGDRAVFDAEHIRPLPSEAQAAAYIDALSMRD